MKRKTLLLLTALPLALLLSSCFVMQGFWINANSIVAGGKARSAGTARRGELFRRFVDLKLVHGSLTIDIRSRVGCRAARSV